MGIGASAGGLEALKSFFGAMPPRTGLVFVVVVHLDPTHESFMPELLAKHTSLVVEQARDRQPLEADHVYIIPPNRTLTIDQGLLRVREVADRRGLRGAIDHFFRSLAEDQHEQAIGIVLSGTGTEGTLGLRAIKAEGGMVMAQAPDTASQPGMPNSAIATGLVDFVLPPEKMPEALLAYVRSLHARPAPATSDTKPPDDLQRILAILRARTKYDFRGYKKGTLLRRIERRMGLQGIDSLGAYAEVLRSHPSEVDQLFKDLLIGVTSFFRDPSAFEELGKVLKALIKERDADAPIRIWVPGCATGEEAYSIAILAAEQIAAVQSSCRVQIFATDIDEDALEIARAGTYPESIALDVSPERLQRFFTRQDHRYTVAKSIRESVTFAVQNVISDPPFSRLDLVSCRNLLIYLEPEVQSRLLSLFHFSLNPGGYLFLGSAEGVGLREDLFAPVSKRRRIFRRLGTAKRPVLEFPTSPLHEQPERGPAKSAPEPSIAALADRRFLEHFAPTGVVVKRTGQIVRSYGAMDRYLTMPPGDVSLDLLTLARDPLKPALRAALHDAIRRHRPIVAETLVKRDKGHATLRVTVRPLDGTAAGESLWIVIFEEFPDATRAGAGRQAGASQRDLVRRLEAELRTTKKEQQHLIEELESSNEELKAANEEILSMNEELQSANEELTTSKEELQSMNEELTTLNAQLQDKVQELTAVNDDLANLLASTDIATVFVDRDFKVKRFTKAATELLNLLPADIGRPIHHLATNLVGVDLSHDVRSVLATLKPIEKEVASRSGQHYFMRMLPYQSEAKEVAGVVLTLVDVTALKSAEQELRRAQDELRRINMTLEQRVAERTKWLTLLHDATRAIDEAPSWDEALHAVLRRICEAENWQIGSVLLPERDTPHLLVAVVTCADGPYERFREATLQQRFLPAQSLPGRVYAEGRPVWLNGREELLEALPARRQAAIEAGLVAGSAFPVLIGEQTIAVLELFSDQPHEPSEELFTLMNDVNAQIARVLERERLTAQIADLVWKEQQELLHTLHDSLGQTLTGLGMMSAALHQQLAETNDDAARTVEQIARHAQEALEQVRTMSKGLFPFDIDPEGLIPALQQLASTTESLHKIRVQVEHRGPIAVRDSRVATQLYRIAQEAVTNAVKHAQARTIQISLGTESGVVTLRVADDGIGISPYAPKHDGLGLRIMQYRARSIGGLLVVEPGPAGGTIVTCSLREMPLPTEPSSA